MRSICPANLFAELVEGELARARRFGSQFSLLALHFPGVEPQMIERIARILNNCVRIYDTVTRIDSNTLVILLPETGALRATAARERLATAFVDDPRDEGLPEVPVYFAQLSPEANLHHESVQEMIHVLAGRARAREIDPRAELAQPADDGGQEAR